MIERSKPFLYLLVGLASIFIIISGIRSSAPILNPILLAVVITIALVPLPGRLMARGLPGWLSIVLTVSAVLIVIGLVLLLVVVAVGQLSNVVPAVQASINIPVTTSNLLGNFGELEMVYDVIESALRSQQLSNFATTVVTTVVSGLSQAFLVMLIFVFMLSAALTMPSSSRLGLRPDHPMVERFAKLTEDVRHYVNVTTVINVMVAIGNTILLLILGIDLAVLWGLLSWFMGYIPAIGFWIAMVPPLILGFAQGGLPTAIIVFAGYVLINGSVENILKPRIMGQSLRISPVVVVVSLFVWGWLLGAVGAILAIPLSLLLISTLEVFDSTSWIATLLRTTGDEDREERNAAFGRVKEMWEKSVATVRNGLVPPRES
ncbi:MAG: AI-2E family transporter [Chloroflexota bacterium]